MNFLFSPLLICCCNCSIGQSTDLKSIDEVSVAWQPAASACIIIAAAE